MVCEHSWPCNFISSLFGTVFCSWCVCVSFVPKLLESGVSLVYILVQILPLSTYSSVRASAKDSYQKTRIRRKFKLVELGLLARFFSNEGWVTGIRAGKLGLYEHIC